MSVLFQNVRVYDDNLSDGASAPTSVLVIGDRIAAIDPDLSAATPPDAHIIEGRGDLLVPGLINAHFHSPVNHMKGMLPSLPLEIFMLYESPDLEALRPSPREAYVRTMLAAMEMLKTGTTSVQDDAFFVPHPAPDVIDAVMQAYRDVGIRATVALDQPELAELDKLPFLAELLSDAMLAELANPPAFGRERLLDSYRHLIDTARRGRREAFGRRLLFCAPAHIAGLHGRTGRPQPRSRPALLRAHAGDQAAAGAGHGTAALCRPLAPALHR